MLPIYPKPRVRWGVGPIFRDILLQWLGVTRASDPYRDPSIPCGLKLSRFFFFFKLATSINNCIMVRSFFDFILDTINTAALWKGIRFTSERHLSTLHCRRAKITIINNGNGNLPCGAKIPACTRSEFQSVKIPSHSRE